MSIYYNNSEKKSFFSKLDLNFMFVIFALNIIGLINLYSATHGPHSVDVERLFISQIIWLLVGWSVFLFFTLIDYSIILKITIVAYIINLGFILYTDLFGKIALGAQRWIDFGFFRYQPSETMKLALIMFLASYFSTKSTSDKGMSLKELLIPLIIILVPFGLVLKQPDLGTGMMLTAIGGSIMLFIKIRKTILITLIGITLIAIPIAWKFVLHDYQKNRVLTFISPNNDPRGAGYNSIQSKIAVGSGKFLGKGFRQGTQSQLEFLPERHTDFIYSVLSEEHGMVGSLLTIGLFVMLFLSIIRIAMNARDKFGALLCVGILSYIFWHMFVNIGMVIGLLPIVGVPLPLLSYGGSSMLTTMTGLGIVSSVAYRRYLF